MNKKRLAYLVALLAIIAAIIIPTVIHSQQGKVEQTAGITAAPVQSGKNQVAAPDSSSAKNGDNKLTGDQKSDQQKTDSGEKKSGQTVSKTDNQDSGKSSSGNKSSSSTKPGNSGKVTKPQTKVGIAIVGIGGKMLFKPRQVVVNPKNRWGVTALGALDATGLPYVMKAEWYDFVDAICGEYNKGVSGWMYAVNGDVPMHMADKHPVKTGDQIIWWYSKSMEQAPPTWGSLQ
jgi:hypothetical protein